MTDANGNYIIYSPPGNYSLLPVLSGYVGDFNTSVAITANKFRGVRAASCNTLFLARMARAHNNANVLALGARVVSAAGARKIVKVFIETKFEGGRHLKRVKKIHRLEKNN